MVEPMVLRCDAPLSPSGSKVMGDTDLTLQQLQQ